MSGSQSQQDSSSGLSLIEEFLSKGQSLRNSKEEKERQNEELVHEMSDVRSDSGFSVDVTPKRSSGACFIDASSLYDETEYSSSSITSASSSRDSRQEQEKRQGYFIFKNSINQFSGHPIGTVTNNVKNDNDDDFEIVDYAEVQNQTPQNSLAYVPPIANNHDDDQGRVEQPAQIYMQRKPQHRNVEATPIVSGGVPATPDLKKQTIESPSVRRRTEMCPILSGGSVDVVEEPIKPKKRSSSVSSASWIVDFSDCKREPKPSLNYFASMESEKTMQNVSENPKSLQLVKSTGFFIDFSDTTPMTTTTTNACSVPSNKEEKEKDTAPTKDDKKNIFSMFIDFDDKSSKKPPRSAPRLSSSYRGSEEPRSIDTTFAPTQKCVTMGGQEVIIMLEDKQDSDSNNPKTPTDHPETPSSTTSSGKPERKRQTDAQINETFDKSSICSLTDGILSKDLSPVSTTDEATYQRDSEGSFVPIRTNPNEDADATTSEMQSAMDSITAAAEKQKQLLETPTEQKKSEFVRLSDMDKPTIRKIPEFDGGKKMSSSAGVGERSSRHRMVKGNIDAEGETTLVDLLASSFENSRSISRIFPHLNDGKSNINKTTVN